MKLTDESTRYLIASASLTVVALAALIIDGDTGNSVAMIACGLIGWLVKDWKLLGGTTDAKEIPQQDRCR